MYILKTSKMASRKVITVLILAVFLFSLLPLNLTTVSADVVNYVKNPGFEADGPVEGPTAGAITDWYSTEKVRRESGGHTGSVTGAFYSGSAFTAELKQVITDLPEGTYSLSVWYKSSAVGNVKMYIKDYGGPEMNAVIPPTGTPWGWKQVTIIDINITGGECELGFLADAAGGSWMALDDVELILVTPGGGEPVPVEGETYYVSVAGDDSNPGTIDLPFKTIQKAADTMIGGDTCIIRTGTYRETVTPANNGTRFNPITYKAYPGEKVTISGTDLVEGGWTLDTDGVYKTTVTMGLNEGNQVFADGEMMIEARWPNYGTGDLMHPTMGVAKEGSDSTLIADSEMQDIDWTGATVWVWGESRWVAWTSKVTSYDNKTIQFQDNDPDNYNDSGVGANYILSGKRDAMDVEKEWYYNNDTLYLSAPGGGDPTGQTVEVKNRTLAFDLKGARNMWLERIDIFGATIEMDSATTNCSIDQMEARYISHVWKAVNGYSSQTSDTGIIVKGENNQITNSEIAYSSGCGVSIEGYGNKLVNCLIHDTDYIGVYASSINANGSNHLISHNTAYNSGRSIFNSKEIKNSKIQYNDFYNCGYLSHDLGVLYIVNTDGDNSEIHHNRLHDNKSDTSGVGLYLDNSTHNFIAHHNLIYNIPTTGIKLNLPGEYNLVYNNTVYNNGGVKNNWGWVFDEDTLGTQFFNNIFTDYAAFGAETVADFNILEGTDPKFADPENGDFRLLADSPAIDVGAIIPGISEDYSGAAPDVGAYEYGDHWTAGYDFENPPSPVFTEADTAYMNRVKNGGFEGNALAPWATTGVAISAVVPGSGMMKDTGNAKASDYGLKISNGEGGVAQEVTGLTPATSYRLSVWLKIDQDETARIDVNLPGESEPVSAESAGTAGQWIREEVFFETGAAVTSATLLITKAAGAGAIYADDIGLVRLGALAQVDVSQLSIDRSSIGLEVGDSVKLSTMVTPLNATNKRVAWSTSNPAVAAVDANGMVTALSRGLVTITATAEANSEVMDICSITVSSAVTPKYLNIGDILLDQAHWEYNNTNGTGAMSHNSEGFEIKGEGIAGYNGSKMPDGLIRFKASFDFNNGGWYGMNFNSNQVGFPSWSKDNDGYLIVVKSNKIELQRWHGSQEFLLIVPNTEIENGVWHEIEVGKVQSGNNVKLVLKVDGNIVFSLLDTGNAVTSEGYLNFYNYNKGDDLFKLAASAPGVLDMVYASDGISLTGSAKITGDTGIGSTDDGSVNLAWSTEIDGDLYIVEEADPYQLITGDRPDPLENVTGSVYNMETDRFYPLPEFLEIPELEYKGDFTAGWWPAGPHVISESGAYGSITVDNLLTVNVGDEDVVIVTDKLAVNGSGSIAVNRTGKGKLVLYVTDKLSVTGSSSINKNGNCDSVVIYYSGSGELAFGGSTKISASIFAKDANVSIDGSGGITGHIVTGGRSVKVTGNAEANVRVIYAPMAVLEVTGSGRLKGVAVVKRIELSGAARIIYDSDISLDFFEQLDW